MIFLPRRIFSRKRYYTTTFFLPLEYSFIRMAYRGGYLATRTQIHRIARPDIDELVFRAVVYCNLQEKLRDCFTVYNDYDRS